MKRITGYTLTAALSAAFFMLYVLGTILAWKSIISREVILTDSIIFFSYQRPFLFGIVFAAEIMTGIAGTVIALWLVKKLIHSGSLFLAGGILVLTAGAGMVILAFFGNTMNETGHTVSFSIMGLFMIILGILFFNAHMKQKQ